METQPIYKIIEKAKNDTIYMEAVLNIFEPLIKKYTNKLFFFDLDERMTSLPDIQRAILRFLLLGYSDLEIAKELKVSRQYINRIKKKIINK